MISVYADGSSSGGADRPGGYGWVILQDGQPVFCGCGGDPATTNNLMELTGAIKGLEALLASGLPLGDVELVCDSQYVLGLAAGEYTPKKNVELALKLRFLAIQTKARCRWVRGHNHEIWNERCDSLARRGKEQCMPPEEIEAKYARLREKEAKKALKRKAAGL